MEKPKVHVCHCIKLWIQYSDAVSGSRRFRALVNFPSTVFWLREQPALLTSTKHLDDAVCISYFC